MADASELFELAREERDDESMLSIEEDAKAIEALVGELEFRRMFSNPMDGNNCFIDIQAGCRWNRSTGLGFNDHASVLALLRA